MPATKGDFEHQVRAGWRLILRSRLVTWDGSRFQPVSEKQFEATHEHEYHRYESWILFSVGAEILLKGTCALAGCFSPKDNELGVPDWGTSRDVTGRPFSTLCKQKELGRQDRKKNQKALRQLAELIRNRDVHGYVYGFRKTDFRLVGEQFIGPINQLVEWSAVILPKVP